MKRYYVSLILDLSLEVDFDASIGADSDTFERVTDAIMDNDHIEYLDDTYVLCHFVLREKAEECVARIRAVIAEHQRHGSLPTVEEIKQRIL